MSVNERIRDLRVALELSQAKFAEQISISSGYIASIELGNRKVNDRLIKLICNQYGVSEIWLREGTGDMFPAASERQLDHIVHVFKQLQPEFQDYVLDSIQLLLELQKKQNKSRDS